ncbi:MAG: hypothetical protein ABSH17_10490 [Syntrophobacteraceae bacterium]|jgi:hypothetical protein
MRNIVCARAVEEPQRVERKVFCKYYECCLDVALSRGWANFSCKSCADFGPVERSAREWIEDESQCADLLSVVFGLQLMP